MINGFFNKNSKERTLLGYITAGDPTLERSFEISESLIRGGIDILELGVPFSDPIADGPSIQKASIRSLSSKTNVKKVLFMVKEIKKKFDIPIVIMTYYNPIFRIGFDSFFPLAKESGVDGIIIPDLPFEESKNYKKNSEKFEIDTIFLAAPSTPEVRLKKIITNTSGFLYLVSHFGVTGVTSNVENSTLRLIKRVLPFTKTKIPLAVGFGISTPTHVKKIIDAGADGAIVGSAFVNIITKNLYDKKKMLSELESAAEKLKKSTIIN